MFNTATYAFIDGVTDFKKQCVEQTVQHEGIKTALNGFIDAQSKYTKSAADAGMQSMMALGIFSQAKISTQKWVTSSKQWFQLST
jgi:hypothetical protein